MWRTLVAIWCTINGHQMNRYIVSAGHDTVTYRYVCRRCDHVTHFIKAIARSVEAPVGTEAELDS